MNNKFTISIIKNENTNGHMLYVYEIFHTFTNEVRYMIQDIVYDHQVILVDGAETLNTNFHVLWTSGSYNDKDKAFSIFDNLCNLYDNALPPLCGDSINFNLNSDEAYKYFKTVAHDIIKVNNVKLEDDQSPKNMGKTDIRLIYSADVIISDTKMHTETIVTNCSYDGEESRGRMIVSFKDPRNANRDMFDMVHMFSIDYDGEGSYSVAYEAKANNAFPIDYDLDEGSFDVQKEFMVPKRIISEEVVYALLPKIMHFVNHRNEY